MIKALTELVIMAAGAIVIVAVGTAGGMWLYFDVF